MEAKPASNTNMSTHKVRSKQKTTAKPISPPTFSDGTEEHHPTFITPFRDEGQLNYYKAYDDDESVRHMWLERFGDELAKLRIGIPNENANPNPNPNADGSTPKKRGPERPSGNYVLSDFPKGYKLYGHFFVPKKQSPKATTNTSKEPHNYTCPITKMPVRRDTYLFGHPAGQRFRSPNEFIPHLTWLLTDSTHDPRNCACKYCPMIVKIQNTLSGVGTPKSAKKKSKMAASLDLTDVEIGPDGPSFRTGEIVWAFVTIPAFRKANGGEGSSSSAASVTTGSDGLLWPSIVLKHIPSDSQSSTPGSASIETSSTPRYHLRSLALNNEHVFTEEQLIPWLAYAPDLPQVNAIPFIISSSTALNAQCPPVNLAELSSEQVGCLFLQSEQLARQITRTFTTFRQYAHKEEEHRLASIVEHEERQRLEKMESYPHYQGLFLGAEMIMIKDIVRLTSEKDEAAATSTIGDVDGGENLEFLEIGSIYENNDEQKIQFTGTIFFRRRNSDADTGSPATIQKEPYLWVPKNKKNAEYTVDLEDLAGRYYSTWPHLRLAMGSVERRPDRNDVLGMPDWKELDEDLGMWTKRVAKLKPAKNSAQLITSTSEQSLVVETPTQKPDQPKFAIRSQPLPLRPPGAKSSSKRSTNDDAGSSSKRAKRMYSDRLLATDEEVTMLYTLSNEADNLKQVDKGKRPMRDDGKNPFIVNPAAATGTTDRSDTDAKKRHEGGNNEMDLIVIKDEERYARPSTNLPERKRGRPRKNTDGMPPQPQPQPPQPQPQPPQPSRPAPAMHAVSNLVEHASVQYARYLQLSNESNSRGLPGLFRPGKGLGPAPPPNTIPLGLDDKDSPMIWHGAFSWPVVNGTMLGMAGMEEGKAVKTVGCRVFSFPLLYGENNEVVASNFQCHIFKQFPGTLLEVTGTSHVDATTELFRNHKNGLGNGQLVGFVPVATCPDDSENHDGFIRILNAMNRAHIAVMIQRNGLCMVLRPAGSLIIALCVYNPALASTNNLSLTPVLSAVRVEPAATPTSSGTLIRWSGQPSLLVRSVKTGSSPTLIRCIDNFTNQKREVDLADVDSISVLVDRIQVLFGRLGVMATDPKEIGLRMMDFNKDMYTVERVGGARGGMTVNSMEELREKAMTLFVQLPA